jgi:hypothetical protein|tara:strand:- start:145 stop:465 length:321 start_codon:yes stop_codon:yes gene_type:complete
MPNQRDPNKKLVAFFVASAVKRNLKLEAKSRGMTVSGLLRRLISDHLEPIPYWVNRNEENYGPYPETKIREMVLSGELIPTDWVIAEGDSAWQSAGDLVNEGRSNP